MHKLLLDISVDAFSGHALHFLTIFGQFLKKKNVETNYHL